MGKTIPRFLEQLDLIKSFVGLATGAGALYLLYKAVRTGLKCHPPLCSNSALPVSVQVLGEGSAPGSLPKASPGGWGQR